MQNAPIQNDTLTHWDLVMHKCISVLVHHWFRYWLVTCLASGKYLNWGWTIVYQALRNTHKWNLNQNMNFLSKRCTEYVVCKMSAILFRPKCINLSASEISMNWKLIRGKTKQVWNHRLLTHLPLVPHICVSESRQHWFIKWLVTYSAPSHYLNQCWVIVNWTLGNKLQWNFNQNAQLFIHENASENIVCERAAILSRVSHLHIQACHYYINISTHWPLGDMVAIL